MNPDGSFLYRPAEFATADTFTYRAIDALGRESSDVTVSITILEECFQTPWYPCLRWDFLPKSNNDGIDYAWYNIEIFDQDSLDQPELKTNVQGTQLSAVEYFLAGFNGFAPKTLRWHYRWWNPAVDIYGDFLPADVATTEDSQHTLLLDYERATVPSDLSIEECNSGMYLLSFLVGNARGYELKAEGRTSGYLNQWRHIFSPGEKSAKIHMLRRDPNRHSGERRRNHPHKRNRDPSHSSNHSRHL